MARRVGRVRQHKLTLAWREPYKVVGKIGDVDYRVEIEPGKVKTYHINMLKRYYQRKQQVTDKQKPVGDNREPEVEVDVNKRQL